MDHPDAAFLYASSYSEYVVYRRGNDIHHLNPSGPFPKVDYYIFYCGQSKTNMILSIDTAVHSQKSTVCSSPNENNFKDYYKGCILSADHPGVKIYMPIWTWMEIAFCNQHLYSGIQKSMVQKRFNVWGGIPRHIFLLGSDDDDDGEKILKAKVVSSDIKEIISVVNIDTPISTVSSQILDAHPEKGDYRFIATKFASHFVAQLVYESWNKRVVIQ